MSNVVYYFSIGTKWYYRDSKNISKIFQMEIGVMDTNVDLVPLTRGVTNEFWMQFPKHKINILHLILL